MRIGRLSVLAIALALGACAASNYEKQVGELSSGFAKLKSSFDTLSEDERNSYIASQTAVAMDGSHALALPPQCKVSRGISIADCTLRMKTQGAEWQPLVYSPALTRGSELAGRLATYGESLVTLTQSKDIADLQDASGKAIAAVGKLAVDVKAVPAEPSGSFANFATWLVGQYLQQARFAELRSIVESADPVVAKAADLLAGQATLLTENILEQRIALQRQQDTALVEIKDNVSTLNALIAEKIKSKSDLDLNAQTNSAAGQRLKDELVQLQQRRRTLLDEQSKLANALISNNMALVTLAKAKASSPFGKMRQAHAELLEALSHPNIAPDAVFGKISDFLDQVEKLKAGIEKGRTAKAS